MMVRLFKASQELRDLSFLFCVDRRTSNVEEVMQSGPMLTSEARSSDRACSHWRNIFGRGSMAFRFTCSLRSQTRQNFTIHL